MAQKLLIVEENTAPDIVVTLQRDGVAIDLTTASTVDLSLSFNGTIVNTGHTACSIDSPTTGGISYSPQTDDFANPGTYKAEAKITYGDGSIERIHESFNIQARTKIGT